MEQTNKRREAGSEGGRNNGRKEGRKEQVDNGVKKTRVGKLKEWEVLGCLRFQNNSSTRLTNSERGPESG